MEDCINFSASRLQIKPERKVIEKNRRNQMKFLYNRLYSLVPPNFISKKGCQVSDRVDRTIDYIQTLKYNLEICSKKKEKLLSEKRSHEQTLINNVCCESLDIQIHQISHDLDAVMVTGLKNYSSFCDVIRLLNRYCDAVTLTNFSSNGHSTFHIRQKQIEAEDVCKRVKNLAAGNSNMKELCDDAPICNEVDSDISVWDFDIQSSVWGCELAMIFK